MKQTSVPTLACMCASFRRAARALTQEYDQALRTAGLRATQFTVLQALSLTGEIAQGSLGELLALDSTTLTRTLGIMRRQGWIEERPGKDRRERLLRLGARGRAQMERALPAWERAQARVRHLLGDRRWQASLQTANDLARALAKV